MSGYDTAILLANAALWLGIGWAHWKARGAGHEIRRMVVAMSDELDATYVLCHDINRLAKDFIPPEKQEAWFKTTDAWFTDHKEHVRRGRRLLGVPS